MMVRNSCADVGQCDYTYAEKYTKITEFSFIAGTGKSSMHSNQLLEATI